MKLYTEEEIVNALNKVFIESITFEDVNEVVRNLTPIELPSDSLCINCDESESTHNICMDCIIKIGKENIQLPSDEEIGQEFKHGSENWEVRQALEFGAKWMRDKIQGGNND